MIETILALAVLLSVLEGAFTHYRLAVLKEQHDQDNDAPWNAVADRRINKVCTRL